MTGEHRPWQRYCEAFWRAHHEAWKRSDLNQREYCEVHGIPLMVFGNWRAKFKAEPQPPERIVPPAYEGRRRKFSEVDKRRSKSPNPLLRTQQLRISL